MRKEYGNPNATNPNATILADITQPNELAAVDCDCIYLYLCIRKSH